MNGRVYDADLGRFISADPTVQAPGNGQSLNRYSYTWNNPLSYTDPSGFGLLDDIWDNVFDDFLGIDAENQNLQPIVQVVATVACGGNPACAAWAPALNAGISASFTLAYGGDVGDAFKAAAISYGTTSAFDWTDTAFSDFGYSGKVVVHGLIGGTSSRLSGGSFKSGFMTAGFIAGASPIIGNQWLLPESQARVTAAAIVGGTASVLGGGKFANGAKTFAFMQMFTEAADYYQRTVGYDADILPGAKGYTDADGMCCSYRPDGFGRPPGPQYDVSGLNQNLEGAWLHPRNWLKQGGPIGQFVNYVLPIGKATSHLHDTWLNVNPSLSNVGTMLPAYAVSTMAVPGTLFRGWESNPMALHDISNPR